MVWILQSGMSMQVDTGNASFGVAKDCGGGWESMNTTCWHGSGGARRSQRPYRHATDLRSFRDGHRYFLNRSSKACRASLWRGGALGMVVDGDFCA